ncbi:MAG: recombination protein RecR [Candidatus Vogelbacteria bacterium]|nr:recombination protein RecR [Candidatus Vogelbacteria bacterium]
MRFISIISKIKSEVSHCQSCFKLSLKQRDSLCEHCLDNTRDASMLMVVAKDIDLENITRSREFNGRFFVLGGLLPILEKNPEQKIRVRELTMAIQKMMELESDLKEIIIALSVNSEGDNTTEYLKMLLDPICKNHGIKLSVLGRGLSTGTELEYSDSDTIKNALKNRE